MAGQQVVVVGSGVAGLTAALAAAEAGATVTVLESTQTVGGTTALSGGVAWLPGNHLASDAGFDDDAESARTYLRHLAVGDVDDVLVDTFVAEAPATARWVEDVTGHTWVALGYPDYHCELPGGREGGRSIEPHPFAPDPDVAALVRPALSWRLPMTQHEIIANTVDREVLARRREDGVMTMGAAVVGSFLAAALRRGVQVRTGAAAASLVRRDGRVVGVALDTGDQVEGAVVLASGGFERDPALARAFLRMPDPAPTGGPGATGRGLRMAMAAGAELGNMSEAWWCPAIEIPGDEIDGVPLHRLVLAERARPGAVMVDGRGNRFANEAQNYNDVGRSLHDFDPGAFGFPRSPSWLVVDAGYRARYPIGPLLPREDDPPWLHRADAVEDLATAMGVDPASLGATVEQFNAHAAEGDDPLFGRGRSAYDRFVGDRAAAQPNLRPLDQPPFYAVRVLAGLLGTKGGPRTDADGRVRHVEGGVIEGLYAAGNVAASPLGMAYPGAGGTIGPALVAGRLAGTAAASR
ncbi:FAD-dependent oxidoreductase [Euzebya sp.]|uniref:FAD-dependent oxidoreductase n=1 Tax=Euzebya sp. TaxID=1971409 RepID=UPI0035163C27